MSLPEDSMSEGENELAVFYFVSKWMISQLEENFKLLSPAGEGIHVFLHVNSRPTEWERARNGAAQE